MKTFSIKEAFRVGWGLWKSNKKLLILSTLIIFAIDMVSFDDGGFFLWILEVILSILSMIIGIGWLKMLLKIKDGQPTELHELIEHAHLFWKYLGTTILLFLMVLGGLLLLVVPGIYFFLKYQFALMVMVDKGGSIKEAFKESARITKGVKWKLLGFVFVSVGVVILGFLALGVGVVVAVPVTMLASIHVYRTLSREVSEGVMATV
mgnify:CR=1 FL=1